MRKTTMMIVGLFLSFSLQPSSFAFAAHTHLEKEYQDAWCQQQEGLTELVLDDQARVDCVTASHAVEVDFAGKWAESIGQALYYGLKTKLPPGVLLILEYESDQRYLRRLKAVATEYGITVWTITPADLPKANP